MTSAIDVIDAVGHWRSKPSRTLSCREVIGTFAA
jgi:hypothetical protein